jgi:2-dehydro-3-deoxygalactonokinase
MGQFLSCDWGTTAFRIRLADTRDGKILAEAEAGQGIADTFNLWRQQNNPDEEQKRRFYLKVIDEHIKQLEAKLDTPLNGAKLIISGMGSSTIGFIQIPYNEVPLPVNGSGIKTVVIPASADFDHDVLVISGIKTEDDIMRGEETQLIGYIDRPVKDELFIFPGTHSKHMHVKDDQVVAFKTYMTGEFFALLSQKSILKSAVEESAGYGDKDLVRFKSGVQDSLSKNLLHSAFSVRVNDLFNRFTKAENFYYLSGLLIGTELKDLKTVKVSSVNLIGGDRLTPWYQQALKILGIPNSVLPGSIDEATVMGQLKIARQINMFI